MGRLCPIHLGHERIINKMIADCGEENCLVVVGSSNTPMSLRHFFSYEERRDFIRKVFPKIKIVGLPDYRSDSEWLKALDDILALAGLDPGEIKFFGGCEEDVRFFMETNRSVTVLNRFDGSGPITSATEIRDCLIERRPINQLVNPILVEDLQTAFRKKWELFKKM